MCVSTLIDGLSRCERSPTPVSVGVNTSWPSFANSRATRRQHHAPCQAPCTRTKVAMGVSPCSRHCEGEATKQSSGPRSYRKPPCWCGRPPTASMCQNEVVEISSKGAVHGQDYPHWHRHFEECFSTARGRRSGAGCVAAQAAGGGRSLAFFRKLEPTLDRPGGLRRRPLLGTGAGEAGPRVVWCRRNT